MARLAGWFAVALLATACGAAPMPSPSATLSPTAIPPAGPTVLGGPYSVSGIVSEVRSQNGSPIQGANVSAWVDQGMSGYSYMWAHGALFTDGSGRYKLAALPAGAIVWLQAWKDGYIQQCASPAVTMQGDTTVDVQLVSKANVSASSASVPAPAVGFRSVSGVVFETTDAGKRPVAGAFVDYEPIMDFPAALTFTDSSGRYLLCGLPEGQTVQLGASFGVTRVAYVSALPGQSTNVDIMLPR
jgi:hypothetical protein